MAGGRWHTLPLSIGVLCEGHADTTAFILQIPLQVLTYTSVVPVTVYLNQKEYTCI